MKEYRTTSGKVEWNDSAAHIESVDDPCPPDGEGWVMCGSVIGVLRFSNEEIHWFWCREVSASK
jgi:hypothetical protein